MEQIKKKKYYEKCGGKEISLLLVASGEDCVKFLYQKELKSRIKEALRSLISFSFCNLF
jgi:hypothetical protein